MSSRIHIAPESWALTTVGEICVALQYGYTASASAERCGPKFLRITDIQNGQVQWHAVPFCQIDNDVSVKYELKPGDIVFARTGGTVGKSFIITSVPERSVFASYLIRLTPRPDISSKYLYYFFQSSSYWEQIGLKKGGLQGNVNAATLSSLELYICPLDEQRRIVNKIETLFSELDKGIESLKTAREQLKVYRQAVLKHAFEGKLTAHWREQNKDKLETPQKHLADANQSLNGVKLNAPASWMSCQVSDALVLGPSNGRSVKDRKGGFPVLRLTALKSGIIDLSESKAGDWDRDQAQAYIVKEGDFLLSRGNGSKGLVGRGGIVPKHDDEVAYPDTIIRLRVDPKIILIEFFSLLWESRIIRDQIEAAAQTTAGIYKINQGHIKGFSLPVPPLIEQRRIVRELEEKISLTDRQMHDIELAIAASETLRQSILKKAFSGQLVPQDPNDEPASALLARIEADKNAQSATLKKPLKRGAKASSQEAS